MDVKDYTGYLFVLISIFLLGLFFSLYDKVKNVDPVVSAVMEECPVYLDGELVDFLEGYSRDDIQGYIMSKADYVYDAEKKEVYIYSEKE